ncbi:hypothetical protein Gogos_003362 [Gossypium gossypioides]|uniref:Uncharacterized protein n=1 Tax=Gossypium gossypioides TaxID=34282 RepID=A0A7J9CLT3_GOSGO|nr:hypothetical protein [Gossypium gossypioides]
MLPQKEGEDSWIDGLSVWKVVLMGYGMWIGDWIFYWIYRAE